MMDEETFKKRNFNFKPILHWMKRYAFKGESNIFCSYILRRWMIWVGNKSDNTFLTVTHAIGMINFKITILFPGLFKEKSET